MTFQIMLYNPKTGADLGKFSWAQITEMIGDDTESLLSALDLFERREGFMLSKLILHCLNKKQVCESQEVA